MWQQPQMALLFSSVFFGLEKLRQRQRQRSPAPPGEPWRQNHTLQAEQHDKTREQYQLRRVKRQTATWNASASWPKPRSALHMYAV